MGNQCGEVHRAPRELEHKFNQTQTLHLSTMNKQIQLLRLNKTLDIREWRKVVKSISRREVLVNRTRSRMVGMRECENMNLVMKYFGNQWTEWSVVVKATGPDGIPSEVWQWYFTVSHTKLYLYFFLKKYGRGNVYQRVLCYNVCLWWYTRKTPKKIVRTTEQ